MLREDRKKESQVSIWRGEESPREKGLREAAFCATKEVMTYSNRPAMEGCEHPNGHLKCEGQENQDDEDGKSTVTRWLLNRIALFLIGYFPVLSDIRVRIRVIVGGSHEKLACLVRRS